MISLLTSLNSACVHALAIIIPVVLQLWWFAGSGGSLVQLVHWFTGSGGSLVQVVHWFTGSDDSLVLVIHWFWWFTGSGG